MFGFASPLACHSSQGSYAALCVMSGAGPRLPTQRQSDWQEGSYERHGENKQAGKWKLLRPAKLSSSFLFIVQLIDLLTIMTGLLWHGQWWGIVLLRCLSTIVYSLSLSISDQVTAGVAPVRGRGAASGLSMSITDTSQTLPSADWLCWFGDGGFLQTKLWPLGAGTDSRFFLLSVWYSTVRS